MRLAFLFPGQGSQRVGMGREVAERAPEARAIFARADVTLQMPLSRLCFEGPEEALARTEVTQPAIFTTSLAIAAALAAEGIVPEAAAGHSLGEYSALAAAGALDFEEALLVVRARGEIMAEIAARAPGGMAAVLGLPAEEVRALCCEAAGGEVVEVGNYNAPDQTVISGTTGAVARAAELARERGAARVVPLKVSAPFHCSLMAAAEERMRQALAAVTVRPPRIPVVANATADYVRTPEEIGAALLRQLSGSVRWTESVARLASDGVTHCLETGPGRVLSGLVGKIAPGMAAAPAEDAQRVAAMRAELELAGKETEGG